MLDLLKDLWEFLNTTKQVARGVFNISSSGFFQSYGYIRALNVEHRWGLEIGVFKEFKVFSYLQEGKPAMAKAEAPEGQKKKMSLI